MCTWLTINFACPENEPEIQIDASIYPIMNTGLLLSFPSGRLSAANRLDSPHTKRLRYNVTSRWDWKYPPASGAGIGEFQIQPECLIDLPAHTRRIGALPAIQKVALTLCELLQLADIHLTQLSTNCKGLFCFSCPNAAEQPEELNRG